MTSYCRLTALAVVLVLTWFDPVSGKSIALLNEMKPAFIRGTAASSPPARPIKRLAHPYTLALEILPRQSPTFPATYDRRSSFPLHSTTLRYTDSFRLTISAFDDGISIAFFNLKR
jgi:hypothetical protein